MRFNVVELSEPAPEPAPDAWIRGPHPKGRCPYTGLARTTLFQLVKRSRGKIKTVFLKKPGAIRGIRLIHLGSLQNYLNSLAETQLDTSSVAEAQEVVS
jgi:hypothetical protein